MMMIVITIAIACLSPAGTLLANARWVRYNHGLVMMIMLLGLMMMMMMMVELMMMMLVGLMMMTTTRMSWDAGTVHCSVTN